MDTDGMTGIAPETWSRLGQSSVQGEVLVARIAAPEITNLLIAAIDSEGRRHLLVMLGDSDPELIDRDSRGIDVATRQLSIRGHDTGRYIDITCNDGTGYGVFDLFGGEVAATLAKNGTVPSESIRILINRWRRFWGHSPLQLLSEEEQLGLFAELWFLSRWLMPKVGPTVGLLRWRGPFGARHDFESGDESIEVKATTVVDGWVHRINGIEQLAFPEKGALFLFSIRARKEASANYCLPDLVHDVREACSEANDALAHFENGLASLRYLDAHEPEYSKTRFRIVSESLFAVRDDFPRLTPRTFSTGVPVGVGGVAYDINLQVAMHLKVAESPEQYARL